MAPTNAAWQADAVGPASTRSTIFSTGWCPGPDVSSYGFSLGSWNLKQGEWNDADWAPPEVDSLLKAGVATVNKAKRFAVYSELIAEDPRRSPVYRALSRNSSVAVSRNFSVPGVQYELT